MARVTKNDVLAMLGQHPNGMTGMDLPQEASRWMMDLVREGLVAVEEPTATGKCWTTWRLTDAGLAAVRRAAGSDPTK